MANPTDLPGTGTTAASGAGSPRPADLPDPHGGECRPAPHGRLAAPALLSPERCVHELFADHAARIPDAPAVLAGETVLTYAELDRRADRLARVLRDAGVGPETTVALGVERTPELVVGVLGIWKAGGAYVPLDPQYPDERLRLVREDAGAAVLL
ncbi:MAG TPA: AMP-binding protein, partial [Longimicrobiaceae bacterium]|nr:AMP-binding protein [Longimicrobiaceae bacterium]